MKVQKRNTVHQGPPPKRNPGLFACGEIHFTIDADKIREIMIKHGLIEKPKELKSKV